jgi:cell division protein ZapA
MAQVTVKINGYAYTVGCENGQEQHLQAMAQQVESRIESIKALGGPTGEGRLLVLAALLMADELHDTNIELVNLRVANPDLAGSPGLAEAKPDPRQARRLSRLARKAEDIAASIEQP